MFDTQKYFSSVIELYNRKGTRGIVCIHNPHTGDILNYDMDTKQQVKFKGK